jgi:hypothetical protein
MKRAVIFSHIGGGKKVLLNFGDLKSVGAGQPLTVNNSVNKVFGGGEAVRPLCPPPPHFRYYS